MAEVKGNDKVVETAAVPATPKKRGRKPAAEAAAPKAAEKKVEAPKAAEKKDEAPKAAEKKAEATKATQKKPTAPKKTAAKKAEPQATIMIQFAGKEIAAKDILAQAKEAFTKANKDTEIKTIEIYVKPEEHAAYYVVNGQGSDDYKVEL